jgi:hypothetical protein
MSRWQIVALGCCSARVLFACGDSPPTPRAAPPVEVEEVVAFEGAQGFGKHALGGRGGDVCHVTTLADSGPGSLRECVMVGQRTVVFDVSGWITLTSPLDVVRSQLTIAGQTAPGYGIGLRGHKFSIRGSDVVVRFLRVRRGTLVTSARDDAMSVNSLAQNVIIDHCSVGFGTDETLSMPGDEETGPRNLTVQWSIVAWGLQKDNHSAGALLAANRTSIHHTLWAFNKTRNPRGRSAQVVNPGETAVLDWINNVVYGWNARDPVGEANGWSLSHHPFILGGTPNGPHYANAIGNYFVASRAAAAAFVDGVPNFNLYLADNRLDGNENGMLDVSSSSIDMVSGSPTLLPAPIEGGELLPDAPEVAYERVLAGAGASAPVRDELDELLMTKVRTQSGLLIQSELDLAAEGIGEGGYGSLPIESRQAGFDSDGDGMPDTWEAAQRLDPTNPEDRNDDLDADGYTNLEEYLSSLVPERAWGK